MNPHRTAAVLSLTVLMGVGGAFSCASNNELSSDAAVSEAGLSDLGASDAGALGHDATASQVAASIGVDGGTVSLEGEVALTVPPDALSSTTTITITRTSDPIPGGWIGESPIYDFGPAGLTFAVPATVAVTYEGSVPPDVVWSSSTGGFDALPSTVNGQTVAASVTHFSSGFAGVRASGADASADGPEGSTASDGDAAAADGTASESDAADATSLEAGTDGAVDGAPANQLGCVVSGATYVIPASLSARWVTGTAALSLRVRAPRISRPPRARL